VRFAKYAEDAGGMEMETFYPEGLSGGVLLDLGDFTSYDIYTGDTKHRARLAGVIIEYHEDRQALVAVKIAHREWNHECTAARTGLWCDATERMRRFGT